jgi:hypothetical protein
VVGSAVTQPDHAGRLLASTPESRRGGRQGKHGRVEQRAHDLSASAADGTTLTTRIEYSSSSRHDGFSDR